MDSLLALDFDGVICDSRPECLITGLAAYSRINSNFDNPPRDIHSLDTQFVSKFFAHRHLVRVAKQFLLLFDLLLNDIKVHDDIELDQQIETTSDRIELYNDFFYAERKSWFREDPETWYAHNIVIDDVLHIADMWNNKDALSIVSAKDEQSIKSILRRHNLHLKSISILDTNKGDKVNHLRMLSQQYSQIYFIDDHLQNLILTRMNHVTPILASWGFVSKYSLDSARNEGIAVLNKSQFVERFS